MSLDRDGLVEGPLPAVEDLDPVTLHEQGGVVSVEDAALMVSVSVDTVRKWIHRRQVLAFRWDGLTWVGQQSLFECERKRRITPQGRPRKSDTCGGA